MTMRPSDAERLLSHLARDISDVSYAPVTKNIEAPPLAPSRLSLLAEDIRDLSSEELLLLQQELEDILRKRRVLPVSRISELMFLWSIKRGEFLTSGRSLADIEPPTSRALILPSKS